MNKELAKKILTKIEETPEQWDQSTWGKETDECGTTFCIAGWACILSEYEPVLPDDDSGAIDHVQKNGDKFFIETKGQELLELTPGEAESLFYESDPYDAYEMLKRWSE